ncbi:hypothetical protein AAC03nite_14010 [Alicyclobacillus acidoterrestris]|uniref:SWIM zinc finger family protein n=1 Tax=Alicyclobacillus suci TaxID=2816080 RepID=UPI0011973C2E|nr:SWIM zinc finger family protein [Alicyclobacillus suci]GEO25616.1 hypothetical protein AAC03nite_14010 [Alicyclobacillus acidoterrestris]
MNVKSKGRASVVENAWKVVLKEADKSRARKGKQDAKSGAVSNVRTHDGGIVASVKTTGPERGTFQVFLPWLADYTGHRLDVAKWLARRPDWIAAHFTGSWDLDFVQFVTDNQLNLFPDETTWQKIEHESKCTCSDWQPVCAHVLALLYHLLASADANPLNIFQFVGLSVDELLDEAHRESARMVMAEQSEERDVSLTAHSLDDTQEASARRDLRALIAHVEPVAPNGRLVPQFIVERVGDGR